jgi:Fe-S cluster assembly iron-binding protein IscA
MLSATSSAKEKLREDLYEARQNEETLLRITPSSNAPQELGFLLDVEKEGDQVITDNDGEKLLLIGEEIAHILSGSVLDYGDTGEGLRFSITQAFSYTPG